MAEKRRTPGIGGSRSAGSSATSTAPWLTPRPGAGRAAAPERRTRGATDTARALVAVGDVPATSVQLQLVERTAPQPHLLATSQQAQIVVEVSDWPRKSSGRPAVSASISAM